jgi:acetyltransferase
MVALDARIRVFGAEVSEQDLPPLAVRPYPVQYMSPWTTKQGLELTIRPIRPEDEPLMIQFHRTLSEHSVYLRYMHLLSLSQRVAHERLARQVFNDYDREMALVAERVVPETGQREIIAVGRLSKLRRTNDAEFAILISDAYQGHGLGTELLRRLVQIGRDEKLARVIGYIASENTPMLRISQRLGFRLRRGEEESEVMAVIDL